ncbi:hypothetical protein SAMN05877809_105107 [Rhodobacter sp. JA431]|uniref:hypothetical protein n=1 Tax=Rhodobacter sp. JA431 TaxID=570013 RepID=UPI000BC36A87|nr:hypothetical protein [Rhodobacter sp. JA431]SOC10342.1 hypothetical protein SAMN05877809_105107 [Rhodobacter sp. JA431]
MAPEAHPELVETLIAKVDASAHPAPLVRALAEDIAAGRFKAPDVALVGLQGALDAAAETKACDDPVLAEVAALNDTGARADAAARLEAALAAGASDALQAAAFRQDRICNAPERAAARHLEALKTAAPAGGVIRAAVELLYEKLEAGEAANDPWELLVALELAKALLKRAKGRDLGQAQTSLANCHQVIGQFRPGRKHLDLAADLFAAAAKAASRTKQPENWAFAQHNLGGISELIGLRHQDSAMLKKAAKAYGNVLEIFNAQGNPVEWANAASALANVKAALGRMAQDPVAIQEAVEMFDDVFDALEGEDLAQDRASARANLAMANRHLGEVIGDDALLRTVLEDFAEALEDITTPAPRARLLHARALTHLALKDLDAAQAGFEAALALGSRDFADYRAGANHIGLARVALARGDVAGAEAALTTAEAAFAAEPASAALKECAALRAEVAAK